MNILIVTQHVNDSAQAIPLAAGNLKATLPDSFRHNTQLIEFYPEQQPQQICAELLARDPHVIAFPLYVWNRTAMLEAARLLKVANPDLITVAGGPEASADSTRVIAEGQLNGVIRGEGEKAFSKLLSCIQNAQPWQDIPGLITAAATDTQVPAAICPQLEQLPSPWLTQNLPLSQGCGVLWEVARGCRFNCAFCFDAKGQKGVRSFPESRLKAELELFRRKQVGQVWILDSTFNAPAERGKQLLRLLLETAPDIHYHIEAKADFLDRETAELLAQLHCSVQIGLQSADPQVLKPLHRDLKPSHMTKNLKFLSEAGVTFGLDLIYGLPNDNHPGFMRSLDFALTQQPNQVDIFPLAVLPGTEIFAHLDRFGITAETQPPYAVISNQSYSPEELRQSRQLAGATDMFYNRGRAVGFFLQLCHLVKLPPSQLLTRFYNWLTETEKLTEQSVCASDSWWPGDILPLQQKFCRTLLKQNRLSQCADFLEDLIHYHYFCAEMVLAQNCCPLPRTGKPDKIAWQRNPNLFIQRFHHPLEEIEGYGGEEIKKVAGLLSKAQEYVIFLRQQDEVIIEALNDDFALLLLHADGRKTLADLRRQHKKIHPEEIDFAIEQGLLLPV